MKIYDLRLGLGQHQCLVPERVLLIVNTRGARCPKSEIANHSGEGGL
jgi:hypothetical protein